LARGERSSPERTREDRERARAERERRRAERAGLPVPEEPPPLESDPAAAAVPPEAPEDAAAPAPAPLEDAPPEAPAAPAPPPVEDAPPVVPEAAAAPAPAPVEDAPPVAPEAAAAPAPAPVEDAPPVVPDPEAAAAVEPEPPAPFEPDPQEMAIAPAEPADPPAPFEPDPQEMAIAPAEPADPPALPPETALAPDLLDAEPGRAPAEPPEAMEPPPVEFEADAVAQPPEPESEPPSAFEVAEDASPGPAADAPRAEQAHPAPGELGAEPAPAPAEEPGAAAAEGALGEEHRAGGEQPPSGYEIPGLPEPPAPAPRPSLPEPPRRIGSAEPTPMRRAFRRGGDGGAGAGAAGLASDGRSADGGRGHDGRSRWIAIVALLAIGIVVAVLVYSLNHSSSSHPAAKGPPEVKVLIPEGKTRLQIAQIASAAGLTGSYRRAARHSPLLNPAQYGAPKTTRTLEGFLFPATYDMDKGAPVQRLVDEQVTAFQENFTAEYAKRAKELGLTSYELLTVASMIEREAQVPSDRAKIAAVIYNRLKAGIPLGIDATIYYAVENAQNIPTYTKELTASQLQTDSAYNTRLHKGLPPTPISNPGVASIQAAAHPAVASYLYYVAGADGCGEQVFSSTEAKFDEDVAAYEAAKRAHGGHLPACKHH